MIERVSLDEIREIAASSVDGMSDHDRDEMAIPSYLHANPMIRWLMWRRYELIAEFLGPGVSGTVLEFGCGMGLFLPQLSQQFDHVLAIDLFPDYAQALATRRSLAVQFVSELDDIEDNSIDCIVAADVLEHIENLSLFLTKFSAKLKPTGRLFVSGPTESLIYKLGRLIAGFGGKGDYHHTNIDALIRDIKAHGFQQSRLARLPFPLLPTLFKICEFRQQSSRDR